MEDEFYATIKLKTGEEIFCKVSPSEEEEDLLLIIYNPIIISPVKGKNGLYAYKVEPWLKTTSEDTFIINMKSVLTMVETFDEEMILIYKNYLKKSTKIKTNNVKPSKKMGYVSDIDEAKKILENLYRNS